MIPLTWNSKDPLVSVVIPTLNRRVSLIRCIESVKAGTYSHLEIIVVDDGSDDGTGEKILADYPDCRLIRHNVRKFPCQSLKDGLAAAHGDYIVVIGDDNVLDSGAIARIVKVFQENPRVAVVGAVSYFLSQPDLIQYAGFKISRFSRRLQPLASRFSRRISRGVQTHLVEFVDNCAGIRRSAFTKTGYSDCGKVPFFHDFTAFQMMLHRAGFEVVVDFEVKTWHDNPVDPHGVRVYASPSRVYHMVRSKVALERDYDSNAGNVAFAVLFPWYVAYYVAKALLAPIDSSARASAIRAILTGIWDGLLARKPRNYFT